jgi:hypothetical protein
VTAQGPPVPDADKRPEQTLPTSFIQKHPVWQYFPGEQRWRDVLWA